MWTSKLQISLGSHPCGFYWILIQRGHWSNIIQVLTGPNGSNTCADSTTLFSPSKCTGGCKPKLPDACQFPVDSLTQRSTSESRSVTSDSLQPHGLYSPWNSLGQNTGVGSLPFSRGSSQPSNQTQVSRIAYSYHLYFVEPQSKPKLWTWMDELSSPCFGDPLGKGSSEGGGCDGGNCQSEGQCSLLLTARFPMFSNVHGGAWWWLELLSIWKTLPSRILILLLRYITREMAPKGGTFLF